MYCRRCRHYHEPWEPCYPSRPYGFWNFMLDLLMICVTGGLWVIWIFIREMRQR